MNVTPAWSIFSKAFRNLRAPCVEQSISPFESRIRCTSSRLPTSADENQSQVAGLAHSAQVSSSHFSLVSRASSTSGVNPTGAKSGAAAKKYCVKLESGSNATTRPSNFAISAAATSSRHSRQSRTSGRSGMRRISLRPIKYTMSGSSVALQGEPRCTWTHSGAVPFRRAHQLRLRGENSISGYAVSQEIAGKLFAAPDFQGLILADFIWPR